MVKEMITIVIVKYPRIYVRTQLNKDKEKRPIIYFVKPYDYMSNKSRIRAYKIALSRKQNKDYIIIMKNIGRKLHISPEALIKMIDIRIRSLADKIVIYQ